jgi:hypothetical protein
LSQTSLTAIGGCRPALTGIFIQHGVFSTRRRTEFCPQAYRRH